MIKLTQEQLNELTPFDVERLLQQLSGVAVHKADDLVDARDARQEAWWRRTAIKLGRLYTDLSSTRQAID